MSSVAPEGELVMSQSISVKAMNTESRPKVECPHDYMSSDIASQSNMTSETHHSCKKHPHLPWQQPPRPSLRPAETKMRQESHTEACAENNMKHWRQPSLATA